MVTRWRTGTTALGVLICGAALAAPAAATGATGQRPCDIYARAGDPCVAAFSTARALYAGFHGPLYEVQRASDRATRMIVSLPSGYADAAAQERFCAHSACRIVRLFDQSSEHNDLTVAGPGGNGGHNVGVRAGRLPITVRGHPAFGMYFRPKSGYRDTDTAGIATAAAPEAMYMIADGTHFDGRCCFDFGNAETNSHDNGNGHMDAINFSSDRWKQWRDGYHGTGPWVQADLENGLLMSNLGRSRSPSYTGSRRRFVTAMLENNGTDAFGLMQGNAQQGSLSTIWSGPLPKTPQDADPPTVVVRSPNRPGQTLILNPRLVAYRPMKKEGAIILGTGGDDSDYGVGSFFEGAMTVGYPSLATEQAVQRNIAGARYRRRTVRRRGARRV
jgi:hypothetical protein